jgi:hypothetical protein
MQLLHFAPCLQVAVPLSKAGDLLAAVDQELYGTFLCLLCVNCCLLLLQVAVPLSKAGDAWQQ